MTENKSISISENWTMRCWTIFWFYQSCDVFLNFLKKIVMPWDLNEWNPFKNWLLILWLKKCESSDRSCFALVRKTKTLKLQLLSTFCHFFFLVFQRKWVDVLLCLIKKNILPTYIRINRNDWALLKKFCNKKGKKVNWKIFERKFRQ